MVATARQEAGSRVTAGMGGGARAEKLCLPGSLWRQRAVPRTRRLGEIPGLCRGLRQQGRMLVCGSGLRHKANGNRPDGRALSGRRGCDHWSGESMWGALQKRGTGELIKVRKCLLLGSPSTLALFNLGFKAFLEPWQIAGGLYRDLFLL